MLDLILMYINNKWADKNAYGSVFISHCLGTTRSLHSCYSHVKCPWTQDGYYEFHATFLALNWVRFFKDF